MSRVRHIPHGSGHPYRIDPDQRHPVQLVGGERFELRVLAPPAVARVVVEVDGGSSVEMTPATVDDLYGGTDGGGTDGGVTDGHLAAASGARPAVGVAAIWRAELTSPAGGAVRYRFVADGTPGEWFDAPVGVWRREGGRIDGADERLLADSVEWLVTDDGPVRARFALRLDAGDRVVGFGERFDALDQRGRELDTTVFEQYKNQGNRTYLPSPFFVIVPSSEPSPGRPVGPCTALHVMTSRRVAFDVGSTDRDRLGVELAVDPADPVVRIRTHLGTPAEVIGAHVAEVGGLRRPPDWVFGPWMSANNWNTQARVVEEVQRSVELGVPVGAVVIEAWSDESTFTVFRDARYDVRPDGAPLTLADIEHPADGAWPDPVGMVKALHDLDVRVLLWQIPIVPTDREHVGEPQHRTTSQVAADAATMVERGYCVAEGDGTPYRNRGWWFPGGLLPDWTNPEATEWWLAKRRYLLDEVGIDGFKTDGGEHAWGDDLRYADGSRGDVANNLFALRYAEAYTSLLESTGRPGVTFSRAGFTGAGRAPCHWAGDENSTWEAFRASITAGLTAGVCGVSFWGWDLAGFSGPLPSVELYVRAAAMAALCPIMQYHSEFDAGDVPVGGDASGLADPTDPGERPRRRDRTPWNVAEQHGDERALTLYRRFAVLRQRLRPQLVAAADDSVATGLPMMRAPFIEFPGDEVLWSQPYQYVLGRDLLVAPACHEGATAVHVALPAGDWVDVWSGERVAGGQVISRDVPWDEIAAYVPAERADAWVPPFAGLPDGLGPA